MLNIQNWIRICFCDEGFNSRALFLDNLVENLSSILLALIVTYHAYLYGLFVAEVLMVVHLAGYKRICLILNSFVKQKVAGTAT